jgi:DNA-binding NtrC family response regulator
MPKILVVDDSRLIRQRLVKFLADEYEVVEAENGKEAILKIASPDWKPDCVVSDLLMPLMDGFALLDWVQKHKIGIPVIILTADIQTETKGRCMELGAYTVLNKPPQVDQLKQTVVNAITGVPA